MNSNSLLWGIGCDSARIVGQTPWGCPLGPADALVGILRIARDPDSTSESGTRASRADQGVRPISVNLRLQISHSGEREGLRSATFSTENVLKLTLIGVRPTPPTLRRSHET